MVDVCFNFHTTERRVLPLIKKQARPLFECFDHGLLFSFEGSEVLKASKHAKI